MRVVVCVAVTVACLAVVPGVASAEGGSGSGGAGGSLLEGPLGSSESQSLLGGQAAREAEEVQRTSPEAVIARQESQTEYEGLGAEVAAKLAGEVFPGVVGHPAGGPPQLPEGQSITHFIGANAAQVGLAQGGHAVLESTGPIATESSPGVWAPIDLGVSEVGGGFQVANPAVGVSIPKRLQEGVSLADSGVSLTPVGASGVAVGGSEGRVDGSVVFYGGVGVGSDVDEVVKPETDGFSEDAVLRSAASPGRLFYRVGLPEGASLVEVKDGSGAVDVVEGGSVIARVSASLAHDAVGVPVPVSMGVEGSLLVLNVDKEVGEYEYPILVDPEVKDTFFTSEPGNAPTNWRFASEGKDFTGFSGSGKWQIDASGSHTEHEWGAVEYTTQGESRIQQFGVENADGKNTSSARVENLMEKVSSKNEQESKLVLPEGNSGTKASLLFK